MKLIAYIFKNGITNLFGWQYFKDEKIKNACIEAELYKVKSRKVIIYPSVKKVKQNK